MCGGGGGGGGGGGDDWHVRWPFNAVGVDKKSGPVDEEVGIFDTVSGQMVDEYRFEMLLIFEPITNAPLRILNCSLTRLIDRSPSRVLANHSTRTVIVSVETGSTN